MTSEKQSGAQIAREIEVPASGAVFTLVICFLIVLLDGLDTTSIAFVAPLLAREWGLPPAAFTPAFVATSLGAVVGYMACGPLAQRFGARAVGTGSVVLFGLGTLLTAAAWDIASLSALRFVSAIGLGGALPIAVAAASVVMPARLRETAAMIVATGLSAGSVAGGVLGGPLMREFGWNSIFLAGGVLPLLVLPLFYRVLSSASPAKAADAGRGAGSNPVVALFSGGLAAYTMLLWLFAFLIFIVTYSLTFWVPTLLTDFGFEPSRAPLAIAAFGMGGLLGNIVMMTLVARFGVKRLLAATTLLAMGCIAAISQADIAPAMVLPLIAGMGGGLITGCVGQAALAVSFYPPELRATGVGWAAALGRVGSIVGPAVGGALLSFAWPAREIVLTALAPALLALVVLAALGLLGRRHAAVSIR